jgi:hypothetical protein
MLAPKYASMQVNPAIFPEIEVSSGQANQIAGRDGLRPIWEAASAISHRHNTVRAESTPTARSSASRTAWHEPRQLRKLQWHS